MRTYATSCAHIALKAAAGNSFLEHYILVWWRTAQRNTYRKESLSLICSCASWSPSFIWEKWPKKRQGDLFPSFMWTWLCARAELSTTITTTDLPNKLYTGKQTSLLYNSSKIVTGSSKAATQQTRAGMLHGISDSSWGQISCHWLHNCPEAAYLGSWSSSLCWPLDPRGGVRCITKLQMRLQSWYWTIVFYNSILK